MSHFFLLLEKREVEMPANRKTDGFRAQRHGATELSCSWCGSAVPLPAGEFSGVCIDCGTVMFRDPLGGAAASKRSSWGMGNHVPAPAV